MAKLVYAIARGHASVPPDPELTAALAARVERVLARLVPDHVSAPPPRIIARDGIVAGICNPVASLPVIGTSVCLGALFDAPGDWYRPGTPAPDGSYALFRADADHVDVLTDIAGTRTVWYVLTPSLFLAATSQRALVMLMGDLEPESRALHWLLSSGTLGPGHGWDRRIACLANDARLVLDRRCWSLAREDTPVEYRAAGGGRREHAAQLTDALDETFETLGLDPCRWLVPLSGGYDSRTLAWLLARHHAEAERLHALTWGLRTAPTDPRGDAAIARRVADSLGTRHEFVALDDVEGGVDFEQLLTRFVAAGEGRTDRISAYIDGFAIWARLHAMDCDGVLRGDEAFGCRRVGSSLEVLRNMHLLTLDELSPVPPGVREACVDVARPRSLARRPDETREAWRDRLNIAFEHPYVFAALNDAKLAYVEVVHPLLSRRIVEAVRALPDGLRTDKRLFRELVETRGPRVPIARRPAIPSREALFASAGFRACMRRSLEAAEADRGPFDLLAPAAREWLDADPRRRNGRQRSARGLAQRIGRRIGLLAPPGPTLSPGALALRIVVAHRTARLLADDSAAVREVMPPSRVLSRTTAP